jgi:hypothetical protein
MTKDAVVLASMEKITLVGVYILTLVVAGVWGWDGRFIVQPLSGIALQWQRIPVSSGTSQ